MLNQSCQENLRNTIQEFLTQTQTPGAAIAIRANGQMIFEAAIGYQDLQGTVPLTPDARFYIYSVTKPLIAAAILDLARQGKLELDGPAQAYVTDIPLESAITVRQLLSHTSGLSDYGGLPAYGEAVRTHPTAPWSDAEFFDVIRTQGLRFTPGEGWAYSNMGYLLLKRMLEQTEGMPWQHILECFIFRPLALQNTFVPTTLEDANSLTPGYTSLLGDRTLQNMAHLYHPSWVSHGVVISTASELVLMIDALFRGQLLDAPQVAQMVQPAYTVGKHPPFEEAGYGLGVMIDSASPYGYVWGHAGGGPGYAIAAFHLPMLVNGGMKPDGKPCLPSGLIPPLTNGHFPDRVGTATTLAVMLNRDTHGDVLTLVYQIAEVLATHGAAHA